MARQVTIVNGKTGHPCEWQDRSPLLRMARQVTIANGKTDRQILNGFNSRCLHVITGEEYRVTAVSPAYNLLLSVRQRRLRYLGHLLRIPHDSLVRRTLIAMAGGGNRYPEGSELKDLETLAVNRTAWRSKVATLVV